LADLGTLCCAVPSCSYNGARTSDQFLDFLKKKLEEDKGFARVEELDKLVKDFVGADKKVSTHTHCDSNVHHCTHCWCGLWRVKQQVLSHRGHVAVCQGVIFLQNGYAGCWLHAVVTLNGLRAQLRLSTATCCCLMFQAKDKTVKAVEKAVGSLKDDAKKNGELYVKALKKALEKVGDSRAGCGTVIVRSTSGKANATGTGNKHGVAN
jgi:hypothetical protein